MGRKSLWSFLFMAGWILLITLLIRYSLYNEYSSVDGTFGQTTISKKKQMVKWCDKLRRAGLGNRLSQYWLDRAIAFWLNLTFETDPICSCHFYSRKTPKYFCTINLQQNQHHYWTQYLPSTVQHSFKYLLLHNNSIYNNISIQQNEYNKWISISETIRINYIKSKSEQNNRHYLSHAHPLFCAVMNSLFVKLIQYEMHIAFTKMQYDVFKPVYNNDNNNIVIHWRCGDLLNPLSTKSYGFVGLSYYRDALKLWNLTNSTHDLNAMRVYVVANFDKTHARNSDLIYIDKCMKLFFLINDKLQNDVFGDFDKHNIYLIGNGSLNQDHYLLSHSRFVICGTSTFCEMVVIGNKHNVIRRDSQCLNNKIYKHIFPHNIQTLPLKNRVIHPKPSHKLTDLADFIINH
eukprot:122_1